MSNTKVKFYRGTHGMGIVISITYGKDRIIFDFGAPFTPLAQVYDGTLKPRYENRVKDAVLLERIPPVEGVFSRHDLQDLSLQAYEESDVNTAVFICHLHLDHMSEIDKIAHQIPVYIHKKGLRLLNALNTVNEEITYRQYSPFEYHQEIKVGQISVTPYYSDHPCPGSAGFMIKTPDKNIYYSGDIRFHGMDNKLAYEDLEELSKQKTDLLIVDSTTTSPSEFTGELITEEDIYNDIYKSLKSYEGLGIFNQYDRDVRMMEHMIALGEKLNRKTVFEPSFAFILNALTGIKAPVIRIDNQHVPAYQKEMLKEYPLVTTEEIKQNPDKYLLQSSYANIMSLSDYDGLKGRYFHLFGEPLVKGQKEYQIMLNVVNKLNWEFKTYTNLYSFSHAYPEHLRNMVEKINATYVVAVHSKHPENLDPVNSIHIIPEDNTEYSFTEDGSFHVK